MIWLPYDSIYVYTGTRKRIKAKNAFLDEISKFDCEKSIFSDIVHTIRCQMPITSPNFHQIEWFFPQRIDITLIQVHVQEYEQRLIKTSIYCGYIMIIFLRMYLSQFWVYSLHLSLKLYRTAIFRQLTMISWCCVKRFRDTGSNDLNVEISCTFPLMLQPYNLFTI